MGFEKVQEVISEVLEIDKDKISMETLFVEGLGADSIDISQIINELEEIYEIEFEATEFANIRSVADAVEYIKNAMN